MAVFIRPTGQISDPRFSGSETALSFLYRLEEILRVMTKISLVPGQPSEPWEYGLLGGLLTIPLTLFGYWQTGSEMALSPILAGGLLAGYLAKRNTGSSRGIGIRAGLVGGLPILLALADILTATAGLSGPSWFVASGTALTVGVVIGGGVLAFGLAAGLGEVGARIGGWLAGTNDRDNTRAGGG